MSLNIPTTHTPPWILLSLAIFQDIEVKWDAEAGEKGHVSYNGITGTEPVRAELEKGIPGKEVGLACSMITGHMLVASLC